jgi:hypothetical protein
MIKKAIWITINAFLVIANLMPIVIAVSSSRAAYGFLLYLVVLNYAHIFLWLVLTDLVVAVISLASHRFWKTYMIVMVIAGLSYIYMYG